MFQNHGINIFNDIYQERNIVTSTNIIDKKYNMLMYKEIDEIDKFHSIQLKSLIEM